jgi:hypothetical protein
MRGHCGCNHHGPAATTAWQEDATLAARPTVAWRELVDVVAFQAPVELSPVPTTPPDHPPRVTSRSLAG